MISQTRKNDHCHIVCEARITDGKVFGKISQNISHRLDEVLKKGDGVCDTLFLPTPLSRHAISLTIHQLTLIHVPIHYLGFPNMNQKHEVSYCLHNCQHWLIQLYKLIINIYVIIRYALLLKCSILSVNNRAIYTRMIPE